MDYICGSEPSVQRFLERTRAWRCEELFWCGRTEKEPRKLGVSGENKSNATKKGSSLFLGRWFKIFGSRVPTFESYNFEGLGPRLVVGKIWFIILLVTSQHTGRGSHPNNGGDKIKSSNLYFWCIKQIHFRSGLLVARTIQTNCDLQVLLVKCSTCSFKLQHPQEVVLQVPERT